MQTATMRGCAVNAQAVNAARLRSSVTCRSCAPVFIVSNLAHASRSLVGFYNKRRTADSAARKANKPHTGRHSPELGADEVARLWTRPEPWTVVAIERARVQSTQPVAPADDANGAAEIVNSAAFSLGFEARFRSHDAVADHDDDSYPAAIRQA